MKLTTLTTVPITSTKYPSTNLLHSACWCTIQWNANKSGEIFLISATRPLCFPVIEGAPSVVMETTEDTGMFMSLHASLSALWMSSPLVRSWSDFNANKSSVTSKVSEFTHLTQMQSWATSPMSVDSSAAKLSAEAVASLVFSCSVKFSDISEIRRVTVSLLSCKLFILRIISLLLLRSSNRHCDSRKQFLTSSPSLNGLPCLARSQEILNVANVMAWDTFKLARIVFCSAMAFFSRLVILRALSWDPGGYFLSNVAWVVSKCLLTL